MSKTINKLLVFLLSVSFPDVIIHKDILEDIKELIFDLPVDCGGSYNRFIMVLSFSLSFEGDFSYHKLDPGGFTYRGISRVAHPRWPGWHFVDRGLKPPDTLVYDFYYRKIWRIVKCDSLPLSICAFVFDLSCLSGTPHASHMLNKAIGIPSKYYIDYNTITMSKKYSPSDILHRLYHLQKAYCDILISRKPHLKVFYPGWMRRLNAVYRFAQNIEQNYKPC